MNKRILIDNSLEKQVSRAYKFSHCANQGKLDKIYHSFKELYQYYPIIRDKYFMDWISKGIKGHRLPKAEITCYNEMIEKGYTSRQVKRLAEEVKGDMKSWCSNYQNRLKKLISKELKELSLEEKEVLYLINSWSIREEGNYIRKSDKKEIFVSKEMINAYKQIAYDFVTSFLLISVKNNKSKQYELKPKSQRLPSISKTFKFNNQVASLDFQIKPNPVKLHSRKSKRINRNISQSGYTTTKDGWLNINGLLNPVVIPLKNNKYANKPNIEFNGAGEISFKRDKNGVLKASIVLSGKKLIKKKKPLKNEDRPVIAIDFGLTAFAHVYVEGQSKRKVDTYGWNLYPKVKKLILKRKRLSANLQRQAIPLKSNYKYNELTRRINELFKSEINRIINVIYKKYNPKKIIVENLDFKDGKGKRTREFNSVMSNYVLSFFYGKLNQLEVEEGVEIKKVNPAYTSQECKNKKCGFTHKNNRKNFTTKNINKNKITKNIIKCKVCGFTQNSDSSGAYGIYLRGSSDTYKSISIDTDKDVVNDLLWKKFSTSYYGKLLCRKYFDVSKSSDLRYHCSGFFNLHGILTSSDKKALLQSCKD